MPVITRDRSPYSETRETSTIDSRDLSGAREWHVPVSAAIGGAAGGFVCYGCENLKKKLQSGQPVTRSSFHPRELYRGSSSFTASVTVATLASMTFRHILQHLPGYDEKSNFSQASAALGGGMLGAIVGSTPVENIILTQQLNKVGPRKALKILFAQGWTRPLVGVRELMMREAGFAGVMLWGGQAASDWTYKKTGNSLLGAAAEVCAGVLGATVTHPFDTVATHRQKWNGEISLRVAVQQICGRYGFKGLFRGLVPRIGLFTGCAVVIPRVEAIVHDALVRGTRWAAAD